MFGNGVGKMPEDTKREKRQTQSAQPKPILVFVEVGVITSMLDRHVVLIVCDMTLIIVLSLWASESHAPSSNFDVLERGAWDEK